MNIYCNFFLKKEINIQKNDSEEESIAGFDLNKFLNQVIK